jgi:MarR family transcriptional regulator for hemolysin
MRQSFDHEVETLGLSSAKWILIAAVSVRPGATQKTIADVLEVTEVTAGRMIDRLCADGYLRRTPHPVDRRAHCVFLTEAAQPLLNRMAALADRTEARAFAGISKEDLARFEAVLDAIEANLIAAKGETQDAEEQTLAPAES